MELLFYFQSKRVFATCILCLLSLISYSQAENFITEVPIGKIIKNDSLERYEQVIKRRGNIAKLSYVKIGSLMEAQKDGYLALIIPGADKVIIAKAKSVKYISEKDYEWTGMTDGDRGIVILLSNKGVFQGHISTPEGVYEILPAPTGKYTLQEVVRGQTDQVGCTDILTRLKNEEPSVEPSTKDFQPSGQRIDPCNSQSNPRILVLYTASALAAAGGNVSAVENMAAMGIAQFNTTINNSGIQSGAVLTLAGVAAVSQVETPKIGDDLESLIANGGNFLLRNIFSADLVVLFTDGYYSGGDVRGASGSVTLQNERSYAVVEIWAATASKTFPHEVGHLFGCRHDGHVGMPNYAQGHNLSNGLWVVDRTMMSTNTADGSNRLLNFSNPAIKISGRATGTADHNNARRISESHSTVGSFRANPAGTFNAYLEGPSYVASEGSRTYELVYKCGSSPYSFSWKYSSDGVNYVATGSNSETLNWYFYESKTLFLKGTVTTNGQSYTAFMTVDAQIPNAGRMGAYEPSAFDNNNLEAFPNPAGAVVKIKFSVGTSSKIELDILDQSGRIIQSMGNNQDLLEAGDYTREWNTKDVPTGVYLCRLRTNGETVVSRIIVTR